MIKKRGFSISTRYRLAEDEGTYWLEVWEQPLHRWLIAEVYHWYDMRIYRMPGFKALERFLERRHENDLWYIPLSAEQDCRCYLLSTRQKKTLASLQVDLETYRRLAARDC